ncbi:MAG: hypothetical protein ACXWQO_04370 [Bdellovibrionota bacterium]
MDRLPSRFIVIATAILLLGSNHTGAAPTRYPAAITIMPVIGNYNTKDATRFREKSGVEGAFLDVTSSIALSPTYTSPKKYGSFSLQIPLVVDYGLEVGMLKDNHAFSGGSAKITMARGHLDLLRVFSIGGGGYYADFSGQPSTLRSHGVGGFACAQFNVLPNGWIHPLVDLRWLGKPMPGQMVMVGLRLGYGN